MTDRHEITTDDAERLDIEPGVLEMLLSNCPRDVTITDVKACWHAVAFVETAEPHNAASLQHDGQRQGMLTLQGHFFPWSDDELEYLNDVVEMAETGDPPT